MRRCQWKRNIGARGSICAAEAAMPSEFGHQGQHFLLCYSRTLQLGKTYLPRENRRLQDRNRYASPSIGGLEKEEFLRIKSLSLCYSIMHTATGREPDLWPPWPGTNPMSHQLRSERPQAVTPDTACVLRAVLFFHRLSMLQCWQLFWLQQYSLKQLGIWKIKHVLAQLFALTIFTFMISVKTLTGCSLIGELDPYVCTHILHF